MVRRGVIDWVLVANRDYKNSEELPECTIRANFRWHLAVGARLQGPLIVTNLLLVSKRDFWKTSVGKLP